MALLGNGGVVGRFLSLFGGGQLRQNERGSQTGNTSASGAIGTSQVSDQRSLQISTVWACVRIISTVTASMPLNVYREENGERTKLGNDDYQLAKVLRYSPNLNMTSLEFREAMTMQLCFYGNAYAYIDRNASGDVVALSPLQSTKMDVRVEDGNVIYRYHHDGQRADYSQSEIFHLKGFGFTGLVGLSPIAYAANTAGVAIAMEDQQRSFYANGAKSPKILMTGDKLLDKQQRESLERNFKDISSGPVDKRLWILEAGFTTADIGVSPQDAETMASRKFQVSEIARFFGIPPHIVGDVEKTTSWGSGIEQQNLGFLQYTLTPYLARWEQACTRWLVPKKDQGRIIVEHNVDGLLRGDSTARADYQSKMVNNGLRTVNEMRRIDNLPPIEGGDVATRQSQNVSLTLAGAAQNE